MGNGFYNNVKTAVLLGLLTGLVLWVGEMVAPGGPGLTIALIMAAVMNLVGYFYSDKIAIAAMKAEEVGPDHPLHGVVKELVQRAGMPMPRVYVAPHTAPNAFATGRNPKNAAVCATEGLLQMLSRDEIAGVMAHELAHVKHRDILIQSVAATIGAAISYLGYMLYFPTQRDDEGGGHPLGALAALILGPLGAALIQASISRSREYNADRGGAEISGDPMHLATALEKIHIAAHRIPMNVNPAFNALMIAEPMNFTRTMSNLFATHPPLEARLKNLIGRESTGMFRYAR